MQMNHSPSLSPKMVNSIKISQFKSKKQQVSINKGLENDNDSVPNKEQKKVKQQQNVDLASLSDIITQAKQSAKKAANAN